MKFKYYLTTQNLNESVNFYKEVFKAEISKHNESHANLYFFGKLNFLIHENKYSSMRKEGYLIIRFEDNELDLYKKTKENIKKYGCSFHMEDYSARWGTTFSEFTDPFGYTWDLEIKTTAFNNE